MKAVVAKYDAVELIDFKRRFIWTLPLTIVVALLAMFGHRLQLFSMSTHPNGEEFIETWSVPNVPMPDLKELSKHASDTDVLDYYEKTQRVYPSIQEQLDMIYKDKINNTNEWVAVISAIKEGVPIDVSQEIPSQ